MVPLPPLFGRHGAGRGLRLDVVVDLLRRVAAVAHRPDHQGGAAHDVAGGEGWRVLGRNMMTKFSNNIRSNFGFLNASEDPEPDFDDRYFVQEGRKVFKEVCPMVAEMILNDMASFGLKPDQMKRLWLHQANINMNMLVARKVFGREFEPDEAPVILDEFANTAGAGSLVAFHRHNDGFEAGEKGLICSFGAGYSAGTVFVEKL
jgi:beta-ketodecanoyl-[acyl-carrier-protein] synthase